MSECWLFADDALRTGKSRVARAARCNIYACQKLENIALTLEGFPTVIGRHQAENDIDGLMQDT
jgi:hypothetical protein